MKKFILGLLCAFALVTATPASAKAPLVVCISGCEKKLTPPGELHLGGAAIPDTQVTDQIWFGPEIGIEVYARDNGTRVWEADFRPSFAYGIHWKPTWSPTASFLAFNLGFAANTAPILTGQGTFDITIEPTITFMDMIKFGYGPRFKLGTAPGQRDSVSGVFFFGLATSFGTPG